MCVCFFQHSLSLNFLLFFFKSVFNLYIGIIKSENTFLTDMRNLFLEHFRTRLN